MLDLNLNNAHNKCYTLRKIIEMFSSIDPASTEIAELDWILKWARIE